MRGRTISSFGQLFGPMLISDGVSFVPTPGAAKFDGGGGRRPTKVVYQDWFIEEEKNKRKKRIRKGEDELLIL